MGPAQSAIKGGDVAVYDSFAVKSPCGGIDAPTAARTMGLPPRRGIVLSFDAKESTKESIAARRLREKASYCPF